MPKVSPIHVFPLALAGLFFGTLPCPAHHFAVELKVESGKQAKSAEGEAADFGVKAKTRPVLKVKAGSKIVVHWTMTNRDPKGSVKNVLVHFFAVKEDEVGQKTTPKLDRGVMAESALVMDFNPNDKARGELAFTIEKAGPYLLRVETIGAAASGANGHEHFAALEVVVE